MATEAFFSERGLRRSSYYVMTCHRRENVQERSILQAIISTVTANPHTVYFPASYRTQQMLKSFDISIPKNLIIVDPVGYEELLVLMVNSLGILTDSGTIVEEAAVLGVPSLQIRRSTERPQVYAAGASVKLDPTHPELYPPAVLFEKLEILRGKSWKHQLGDGKASQRIVDDLLTRLRNQTFRMHQRDDYHLDVTASYREDGV
jgi:UDP-N-acetylglucosamine 2-epimerase (non-hydrolysing)